MEGMCFKGVLLQGRTMVLIIDDFLNMPDGVHAVHLYAYTRSCSMVSCSLRTLFGPTSIECCYLSTMARKCPTGQEQQKLSLVRKKLALHMSRHSDSSDVDCTYCSGEGAHQLSQ